MKRTSFRGLLLGFCAWLACAEASAQLTNRTLYTLVEGSFLVDECLICGRPTIFEPLRGTFELVPIQITPPYSRYAISNINFKTGIGGGIPRQITGSGTYQRFEEFAMLQDMSLAVQIKDSITNKTAFFTNVSRTVSRPFPLIRIEERQTNGTLIQTYTLDLFAAPVREIWFSAARGFSSTNPPGTTNKISGGDLISTTGRVVKRNADLVNRLGIMPPVADLGLDAVQVTHHGEILFSLPADVFSETLGKIQHGDLLSNKGVIVKRNQDLLAAFHPLGTNDAGLDAFRVQPDGEILFSIQSNMVTAAGTPLSRGDILSDRGHIFLSHNQLMANFHPTVTSYDFGLDALHILPSGEIWFSVEEAFNDQQLGPIQAGDLLSSFGYRVFSNQDLVALFAPVDPSTDYGLDGLCVISDLSPPNPPPRILRQSLTSNSMHLEWDGQGEVFQIESTPDVSGSWSVSSPIVPDLIGDVQFDLGANPFGFFRLRQW